MEKVIIRVKMINPEISPVEILRFSKEINVPQTLAQKDRPKYINSQRVEFIKNLKSSKKLKVYYEYLLALPIHDIVM